MLPCTGCAYLVTPFNVGRCTAVDNRTIKHNPLTGLTEEWCTIWPLVETQRAATGKCGTQRVLYEPTIWQWFICHWSSAHDYTDCRERIEIYEHAGQMNGVRKRITRWCVRCNEEQVTDVEMF